jgi:malate dehydrogenase (oxaloacetate-decarboxylating)(NADP+)
MKRAAVEAIAGLAREEPSDVAARAYGGATETFGPNYLIPSPFDQRLILRVAPAVARAAMETGVATRPIEDFTAYLDRLNRFVFRSGLIMKPIIQAATQDPKRIIYAEGEDERVLRAAQVLMEDKIAKPILVGRPDVLQARCERFGLKIRPGGISSSSTRRTIPATGIMSTSIFPASGARACRRMRPARSCAPIQR